MAGIYDYRSHPPCIRGQSIITTNTGYSWAASQIAGVAASVNVDHKSIRVCQE
jgi:hypothetical protein